MAAIAVLLALLGVGTSAASIALLPTNVSPAAVVISGGSPAESAAMRATLEGMGSSHVRSVRFETRADAWGRSASAESLTIVTPASPAPTTLARAFTDTEENRATFEAYTLVGAYRDRTVVDGLHEKTRSKPVTGSSDAGRGRSARGCRRPRRPACRRGA